jgi:hypothetical protein
MESGIRTEAIPPTNMNVTLAVIRLPATHGRDSHILCTMSEIRKISL